MMAASCFDSLRVDRRDRAVDRLGDVLVEGDGALQRLLDQRLDQVLRAIRSVCFVLAEDLVEQARRLGRGRAARRRRRAAVSLMTILSLAEAEFAGQRLQLSIRLQHLLQQALQLLGAVDLGQQVAQLVARLQQLLQRRHLRRNLRRLEVLDAS